MNESRYKIGCFIALIGALGIPLFVIYVFYTVSH